VFSNQISIVLGRFLVLIVRLLVSTHGVDYEG